MPQSKPFASSAPGALEETVVSLVMGGSMLGSPGMRELLALWGCIGKSVSLGWSAKVGLGGRLSSSMDSSSFANPGQFMTGRELSQTSYFQRHQFSVLDHNINKGITGLLNPSPTLQPCLSVCNIPFLNKCDRMPKTDYSSIKLRVVGHLTQAVRSETREKERPKVINYGQLVYYWNISTSSSVRMKISWKCAFSFAWGSPNPHYLRNKFYIYFQNRNGTGVL